MCSQVACVLQPSFVVESHRWSKHSRIIIPQVSHWTREVCEKAAGAGTGITSWWTVKCVLSVVKFAQSPVRSSKEPFPASSFARSPLA